MRSPLTRRLSSRCRRGSTLSSHEPIRRASLRTATKDRCSLCWRATCHHLLNEFIKIPISCCYQIIDLLLFWGSICLIEFLETHVSTAYSGDQFIIQDFSVDFLSSKEIVTITKSPDRKSNVPFVDVLSKKFINKITFNCFILAWWWWWRFRLGWFLYFRRFLTECFFKTLNNLVFISQDIL